MLHCTHESYYVGTCAQGVAEAESRRAADIAEAAYQQAFNQDIPADEAALDREFTKALSAGQAAFREVAVGETCRSCQELQINWSFS